mmetsp:Transcript_5612/g.8224  ORF Transcript_5612/g.8224 Transcript_5612/m.8224 type:complete len:211 (-) Transcript_5612:11156-11788(-)
MLVIANVIVLTYVCLIERYDRRRQQAMVLHFPPAFAWRNVIAAFATIKVNVHLTTRRFAGRDDRYEPAFTIFRHIPSIQRKHHRLIIPESFFFVRGNVIKGAIRLRVAPIDGINSCSPHKHVSRVRIFIWTVTIIHYMWMCSTMSHAVYRWISIVRMAVTVVVQYIIVFFVRVTILYKTDIGCRIIRSASRVHMWCMPMSMPNLTTAMMI